MIVCQLSIICGLFIYNNQYIGYRVIAAIIIGFLNIQFTFQMIFLIFGGLNKRLNNWIKETQEKFWDLLL